MLYRKKPVVIEASQWFKKGDHEKVEDYVLDNVENNQNVYVKVGKGVRRCLGPFEHKNWVCKHCGKDLDSHGWIETLEGGHIVCPEDWIITGVNGEYYPCKPDIFDKTYEFEGPSPYPNIPVKEALKRMKQGEILNVNKDHDEMRWNKDKRRFQIRYHDDWKKDDCWINENTEEMLDYDGLFHKIGVNDGR